MGDPLSTAASVAGLLSLSLQNIEYLYKYYSRYTDQDKELAQISHQISGLLSSISVVQDILHTRQWLPDEQNVRRDVEGSITSCEDVIHDLGREAAKFKKEPKDDWKKKVVLAGRKAAYPLRRSTIQKLNEDIEHFRDNLSLALQALQLKEYQNTKSSIEDLTVSVKQEQAKRISKDVRRWLAAPDATIDFNVARQKCYAKTGQWLIRDSNFTTWLQEDNSFLWLYGFAGCGKSVLCSTAIQHVLNHNGAKLDNATAFFFFTFNDDSKQDDSAALRALLMQLCGQIPSLEADLNCRRTLCNNGAPSVPVLMEHLRQAIATQSHVYILLDALDESPMDSLRTKVLAMVETMRQWKLSGLHLLVTSRDIPDIRSYLKSTKLGQNTKYISLKNDSIQQDISQYVSHQIEQDPQLQQWSSEQREKIKNHLSQHANGVFRWVECQLQPLRRCAHSTSQLDRCLKSLPQSLDETYERMLCNIGQESWEEAQQLLPLLCFSFKPLTVDEVIEAMAVDIDDQECYDSKRRLVGADDLLRICPGLIDIYSNSSSGSMNLTPKVDVEVRIAHFSVQEYLLSDRIQESLAADFALIGSVQHYRICKACLLYLDNNDFTGQQLTSMLIERYSWASYAAEYWPHHYRQAGKEFIDHLSPRVLRLLTAESALDHWIRLSGPEVRTRSSGYTFGYSVMLHPSPVYYAALLGLRDILETYLTKVPADIDVVGGKFDTALKAATSRDHSEIVRILLDRGASIDFRGRPDHSTALQLASRFGHKEVVVVLLDRGADTEIRVAVPGTIGDNQYLLFMLLHWLPSAAFFEEYSFTALDIARMFDQPEVVQLLLERGAHDPDGDDTVSPERVTPE